MDGLGGSETGTVVRLQCTVPSCVEVTNSQENHSLQLRWCVCCSVHWSCGCERMLQQQQRAGHCDRGGDGSVPLRLRHPASRSPGAPHERLDLQCMLNSDERNAVKSG